MPGHFHFANDPFEIYHCDNGGEFRNAQLEQVIANMNAKEVHGAPRHPQSQGQIERFNGTLSFKH